MLPSEPDWQRAVLAKTLSVVQCLRAMIKAERSKIPEKGERGTARIRGTLEEHTHTLERIEKEQLGVC